MTDLRQAAQQLIDRIYREGASPMDWREYYALEDALEQQAEPVAWLYKKVDAGLFVSDQHQSDVEVWNDIEWSKPLYTTPPQRQWVGLTDDEIKTALVIVDPETKRLPPGLRDFARVVEAKLKERNA